MLLAAVPIALAKGWGEWGRIPSTVWAHLLAITGALLVAGFFTFPFDRLLGHWLFG